MKKLSLLFILLAAGAGSALAQPKVIAHRGYWKAPNSAQNSLASFSKADSIGVFASEIDVWLTADDRLIVNHDRVFKGTDINMERSTQRDICNIVLANGENIPTLDAYLKLVTTKPDTRLVLEMKSLSDLSREDLAAEKIVKALRKYGLVERTDIIAFSLNACLAFKKLLPDSKIYYLDGDLTPKKIKKLGLAGIDYSIEALRKHPEWVEQAHKLGLEVNVWTVDKEEDMRYFIDLGVDYITTNYPEQLQQLIGHLAPGGAGLFAGELLPGVAGVAPHRFVRVQGLEVAHKGQQLPLVLRFHGFAAQQGKPGDVVRLAGGKHLVAGGFVKGLAVAEVPCHSIEAPRAVVAAAGHEYAGAHARAVGDVVIFNGCVVHK